jgi:hypothetical protein
MMASQKNDEVSAAECAALAVLLTLLGVIGIRVGSLLMLPQALLNLLPTDASQGCAMQTRAREGDILRGILLPNPEDVPP